jgi:hypothetical protein
MHVDISSLLIHNIPSLELQPHTTWALPSPILSQCTWVPYYYSSSGTRTAAAPGLADGLGAAAAAATATAHTGAE